MLRRFLPLILFAVALAAAKDTANDFDPGIDFSQFRTFSFVKGIDLGHTGVLNDPNVRERIKNFISGVLELRQLREVPIDEKYDLAVRYWFALKDRTSVETVLTPSMDLMYWGGYPPYWYGPWSGFYEEYVVRNYIDGTLVVDLIDPKTKELVWRTLLRQKIEDRAKAYKQAKKNLENAFEEYPPSEKDRKKMQKEKDRLAAKYR